jgi:hypothetical protein
MREPSSGTARGGGGGPFDEGVVGGGHFDPRGRATARRWRRRRRRAVTRHGGRLRTCGTCRTLWWCTTRYAVVRKARKRLVGVARTYSTEAPGRTSKRSYRPIPNRNRNPDPDPDPDSCPNPNPSPSPNVASVGIGQREAKALYGREHLLVRDRA